MRDLNSEYLIQDNWGSHTSPYTHNWLAMMRAHTPGTLSMYLRLTLSGSSDHADSIARLNAAFVVGACLLMYATIHDRITMRT